MADTKKKKQTSSKSAASNKKKEPEIPRKTSSQASRSSSARSSAAQASGKKKETPVPEENYGSQQGLAIVFFGLAAFLLFLVIIEGESVWNTMHNAVLGVFGVCSYVIPIILGYIGINCSRNRPVRSIAANLISAGVFIVFLSCFIHLVKSTPEYISQTGIAVQVGEAWQSSGAFFRPGVIGAFLGGLVGVLFGKTGAIVTVLILMIASLMFLTGLTIRSIASFMSSVGRKGRDNYSRLAQEREERRIERLQQEEERRAAAELERQKRAERTPPLITDEIPPVYPSDKIGGDTPSKIPTAGSKGNKTPSAQLPLIEPDMPAAGAAVTAAASAVPSLIPPVISAGAAAAAAGTAAQAAAETVKKPSKKKKSKTDSGEAASGDNNKKPSPGVETSAGEISVTRSADSYIMPPVTLLDPPRGDSSPVNAAEMQRQGANKLIETLESFRIKAQITDIVRGPSVTRYELVPDAGVRINKITSLSDDIALRLAAKSVRIEAPIPGKSAIGIEVPNDANSMVTMRELIDTDEYRRAQAKSKLTVALGKDITGKLILADIAKMPHLLVAGTTGSGKSVCLNTMIISLIYNASPDEIKFVMIDPKQVEFTVYNGIAHLEIPVVSNPRKATGALGWAVSEMEKRYKLFAEQGVRDIDGFNKLCRSRSDLEKMHRIVIFIDELSDLMMTASKEVEDSICRLAQMARAAGIHLVIATQRPTTDVVTGLIRANIPSRIALFVSQALESRIIIDQNGAEKLLGHGDMLFAPVGSGKPTRVQGCFVSDDEVERVTNYIRSQSSAEYSDDIMREIEEKAAAADGKHAPEESGDDILDPMYNQAVECVIQAGQASTTMLQKKLKLGYARASRVMDQLEETKVVGPSEGAKPRQVLITAREWYERQALAGGVAANKNVQMSFGDMENQKEDTPPFDTDDEPEEEYEDFDEEEEAAEEYEDVSSEAPEEDGFADIYEDDEEDEDDSSVEDGGDAVPAADGYEDISSDSGAGIIIEDVEEADSGDDDGFVSADEFGNYINSSTGTDTPVEIPVGFSEDDENPEENTPEEVSIEFDDSGDEFGEDDDSGDDGDEDDEDDEPEEVEDFYSDDDEYIDPPVNIDDIFADDSDYAGTDDYD